MSGACLVVGAGEGVGNAVAAAFAQEGLTACLTRRARNLDTLNGQVDALAASGLSAKAFGVDARDEAEMVGAFRQDRVRDWATGSGGVQHRRQRHVSRRGDDIAGLYQGVGNGRTRWFP